MPNTSPKRTVPRAMQVQLSRLFGSASKIAQVSERSDPEWRRDLKLVLNELESYINANVITEASHLRMILSGLYVAREALNEEEFWPAYAEGITRVALCLLGNYPDHRKRKGGAKNIEHYELGMSRTMTYSRNRLQMLRLLCFEAPAMGIELSVNPLDALRMFRDELGYKIPQEKFLDWFKDKYPADWGRVF